VCLYTQDTFRVGATEGENLSNIPWKFYSKADVPPSTVKTSTERWIDA